MSRIPCTVADILLEGDHGEVESVEAVCGKCSHSCEAYGRHEDSRKRALVSLNETCPNDENNYYVEG